MPSLVRPARNWTVTDGYFVTQSACTPDTPGNPEFITWDAPGFLGWIGGTGMIHDSNRQLGGQFSAHWVPLPGYWDVEYQFC